MTRKKGFPKSSLIGFILIILSILIIVNIYNGGFASLFQIKFQNTENLPNAKLSDLSWQNGVYKIFYVDDNGLNSINTDGTNKKQIYERKTYLPDETEYFLLNSSHKILYTSWTKVVLMNEDGSMQKTLFEISSNNQLVDPRVSADGTKLIVQVLNRNISDLNTPYDIFLIDLASGKSSQITNSRNSLHYGHIKNIFWYKDNRKIFLISETPSGADNAVAYAQYSSYDTVTGFVSLIYQRKLITLFDKSIKHTTEIINTSQLVEPEIENSDSWLGNIDGSASPDGSNVATNVNGSVLVNGVAIIPFTHYDPELNRGYGLPTWLPDNNHFVVTGTGDVRIAEYNTKKTASLVTGFDVKWFNEVQTYPGRLQSLANQDDL